MSPQAVGWYRLYCGILAALYFVITVVGVLFVVLPSSILEVPEMEKFRTGAACLGLGLPLLVATLLPLCLKPRPWLWIYGIVLIAFGLARCCLWPICIPLLIFWLKPDVKGYFGR